LIGEEKIKFIKADRTLHKDVTLGKGGGKKGKGPPPKAKKGPPPKAKKKVAKGKLWKK